jgi:gluconate 2-dehydrogenase gamma chain
MEFESILASKGLPHGEFSQKGIIDAHRSITSHNVTSENKDLQLQLGGGIMWLDATCIERYGQRYLQCDPGQQTEMLDLIAFRKNADKDPKLSPGIEFFSTLRKYTADAFFTSEIGIKYLGYIGNTYLKEFPGCPTIPEA